ncbi:hypothetical protein BC629DRAFT_1597374 [Irpex lacteus]|nr:hypothetical protein BC629DRAFT_1597374 [Irpex lacteus]
MFIPFPLLNINEASITGNAEVMEAVFEELEQPITQPEFMGELRITESVTTHLHSSPWSPPDSNAISIT